MKGYVLIEERVLENCKNDFWIAYSWKTPVKNASYTKPLQNSTSIK